MSFSRVAPVGRMVLKELHGSGFNGVIVGGAAACMLGSPRQTKDVDIDATGFPPFFKNRNIITTRRTKLMMKLQCSVQIEGARQQVKCDLAIKRADMVPTFLRFAVTDKQNGLVYAGPSLLLADKIRTLPQRTSRQKQLADFTDILFAVGLLRENGQQMPPELKSLYTQDDWDRVMPFYLYGHPPETVEKIIGELNL